MSNPEAKKNLSLPYIINATIGIAIMLFGRYLPPLSIIVPSSEKLQALNLPIVDGGVLFALPPKGMLVLTIFIGVIYLWTTVDTLWPSVLGVCVLAVSDYAPAGAVLGQYGSPQMMNLFFIFMFVAIFAQSELSPYVVRYIMTKKVLEGRPWLLSGAILAMCFCVAVLSQVAALFIVLPIVYMIFKELGLKKGDRYVSMMLVNILFCVLFCFASDSIKGGGFILVSNLKSLAASDPNIIPLDTGAYLLFGFTVSIVCIFVFLFAMRFIFRVNVSALKDFKTQIFLEKELPPVKWQQKSALMFLLVYAGWMLVPSIIGKENAIGAFLAANSLIAPIAAVFLAFFIQYKGEPACNFNKVFAGYPWRVFFLVSVALLMGGAMTSQGTNIPLFLESFLGVIFDGLSYTVLLVITLVVAMIFTNFFNSVVVGFICTPLLIGLGVANGFMYPPLLACFFYVVLIAALTAAGSPYAAILFDQEEWINGKDIVKYGIINSIIVILVTVIVGMPLSFMLF